MKVCLRTTLLLFVLSLALSAATFAAEDATLYIVHGVPGRDVAANLNPGLPVDVLLNDEVCYLHGLAFGTTSGPLTFSPGEYDVKVSTANTLAPCTNSPVVETTVRLSAGSSVTAVVALNSSAAPSLVTFTDSLTPIKTGEGRYTFANAADAPALEVTLTELLVKQPITRTFTVNPGQETSINLPVGSYSLQAKAGSTTILSGRAIIENQTVTLTYAVGSASNNSVSLVTSLMGDVF